MVEQIVEISLPMAGPPRLPPAKALQKLDWEAEGAKDANWPISEQGHNRSASSVRFNILKYS